MATETENRFRASRTALDRRGGTLGQKSVESARRGADAVRDALERWYPSARIDTRRRLAEISRIQHFAHHDLLIETDDHWRLIGIISGSAAIHIGDIHGNDFTLRIVGPGEVVGIRAVLPTLPLDRCLFDLRALTEGCAASWSGPLLWELVTTDTGLALGVLQQTISASFVLQRRLTQIVFEQSRDRLVDALYELEPLLGGPDPSLSRSELASILGVSREMADIGIRDLEARNIIERDGPAINIIDMPALIAELRHDRARNDAARPARGTAAASDDHLT
jgi:CRP-like cAMP-binding protein